MRTDHVGEYRAKESSAPMSPPTGLYHMLDHYVRISHKILPPQSAEMQAMSLISVAQQSGDVSGELYGKYAAQGCINMPRMDGIEEQVVKLQLREGGATNPFGNGGSLGSLGSSERPPTVPDRGGMAPLGMPGVSPAPSSQVIPCHLFWSTLPGLVINFTMSHNQHYQVS